MKRLLVLPAIVILLSQASSAMAQTIKIQGKLDGGNFVSAVCSVGANGQISGTGVLYGQNAATGATYKYPFVISKGVTAQGKLILTGNLIAGPAVTLSASVPNGAMVFSYVINGKTYSYAGTGTVLVQ